MKQRSNFNICMGLIGLVKPLSGHMTLAVLLGSLGHLLASFITILGAFGIAQVLQFSVPFSRTALFVMIGIFAVLRGVLRYGEQTLNHYIAFKLLALIRDKVFASLRRLAPAKLESKDKGNLISIITSDIELLEVFYAHTISPVLIALITSLVMCVFIGLVHPALAGIAALAYLSVGVLIPLVISKMSGESGRAFRAMSGELSHFVLDSMRGLSEILQYGVGTKRLAEIRQRTEALSAEEKKMKRRGGIAVALSNTVILAFDLLMLFVAALLFQSGRIGFDGLLISVIALMSSFGPVVALANLGAGLQNTFGAGGRVLDILEEEPVTEDVFGKEDCAFTGARVEKVSFAYKEETILSDLSLELEPNTIVAISGKSGSGKSTLLRLLMRFWEVDQGAIRISGRHISEINTANLREMESFVTQETHLFHDSIRNNVRIARLDASDEEIEDACRKASIHDFIQALPDGYDTHVGELGLTLSGGERQRIGLARAFLHDAPFMLLDEPTSKLDSLNEAIILKSICEQSENKTIALVSHRPSTIRIADKSISVEHGRSS